MRWYPSGKLNFTAADLAVLSHPAFASKPWAGAGAWLRADPAYPPIPSALVFSLLAGPRESRPERMWKQYRKLLEIANDPAQYYVSHEIVQHRKPRTISAPFYELAQYQRWILKNILERAPTTDFAFAYKKGLTLADNARVHLGRSVIVKLDLVHFFDSITFGMVYEVFAGQLRYPQETAVLLANLCCLNGRLPQGACTSPYLSNLCFAKADGELAGYCREKGLAYSRYSDDLTFSGDRIDVKELIAFVRETVKKYGFSLNYRKIHVDGKGRRHRVTGIVQRKAQRGRGLSPEGPAGDLLPPEIRGRRPPAAPERSRLSERGRHALRRALLRRSAGTDLVHSSGRSGAGGVLGLPGLCPGSDAAGGGMTAAEETAKSRRSFYENIFQSGGDAALLVHPPVGRRKRLPLERPSELSA